MGDMRAKKPWWWDVRFAISAMAIALAAGAGTYFWVAGSSAATDQSRPAVAFLDQASPSKGVYLATWTDKRDGSNDIVGATIGPRDTTVKSNFPICTAPGSQTGSAVAASATSNEFLVVWQDQRGGGFRDIYGQRVRYDNVLQGTNIAVSTAFEDQTDVAVAHDPAKNQYLVVWQDYRNGGTLASIYGQLVNHDGTLVGTNFAISSNPSNAYEPSVDCCTTDGDYLVVWEDDRSRTGGMNVYGQRVSNAGKLVGSEISVSSAAAFQTHPEVACNAASKTCLVVWQDHRNTSASDPDVYAQRVGSAGVLVGGNFAISTAPGYQGGQMLSVVSGAQGFLITFDDTRNLSTTGGDIYAQRVSASGALTGSSFPVSDQQDAQSRSAAAYASKDASYLVIWEDWRDLNSTGTDLFGQHLDSNGTLLGTVSSQNFVVTVPGVTGKLLKKP